MVLEKEVDPNLQPSGIGTTFFEYPNSTCFHGCQQLK